MAIDNDNDTQLYDDEDLDEVDFDAPAGSDFRSRGRQVLGAVGRQGRQRLGQAANQGKQRVADHIDDFGGRVSERISYGADYLRTNDVTVIADDIVDTVRRHPLISAGVAVGAGSIAGKIIGIGNGGGRKKSKVSKKIRRAVVSSLAAMAASRLKDSLTSQVMDAFAGGVSQFNEEVGRPSRGGRTRRKAGGQGTTRGPKRSQTSTTRRRRRPAEDEY